MLFQLDPFDQSLRSFSMLTTGSVGSGKSFLLKLLLMGLKGCETTVVEQSEPPEYAGIPGVKIVSLADMSEAEQAAKLREFVSNMWETARRDPRPRLLVLDELWSLIRRPELALLVEEIARRGRKFFLSLIISTQQIEELIAEAKAVFDNAAIKAYLQQENRDIAGLAKAARLSADARVFLRTAARGEALFDVNGMLLPVDIQTDPVLYRIVNTDPREVSKYGLGDPNSETGPAGGSDPDLGLAGSGTVGSSSVPLVHAGR
jgi:DNA helicase HerA-like ATPase